MVFGARNDNSEHQVSKCRGMPSITYLRGMHTRSGKYRHYKGKEYEVIGTARHSETMEELVVYRALYATEDSEYGSLWVRPASMFAETVLVNGKEVPRFEFAGE